MSSPRKEPRINLRFDSNEEMDTIELRANQDGLNLQNWIRQLIRIEMASPRLSSGSCEESFKSQLKSQAMLETLVDKHAIDKAETISTRKIEHYNDFKELW